MIVHVSKGASFKGAATYLLHDKQASTTERVAWTDTLNLSTDDPERAWRQMAATAINAPHLKAAAGVSSAGRKTTKPVYAYSLSWQPDDGTPDRKEMMKAVRESLEFLGFQDRQALIVCHDDTDHPHVHVMVNRISPIDGTTAKDNVDHLKLSNWAERYCDERGIDACPQRKKNNELRRKGQFVKHDPDLKLWRRTRTEAMLMEQRAERAAIGDYLYYKSADIRQKMDFAREDERAKFKPMWRDLYRAQNTARNIAKVHSQTLPARVYFIAKWGDHFDLKATDAVSSGRVMRKVESTLAKQRGQFGERVTAAAQRAEGRAIQAYENSMKNALVFSGLMEGHTIGKDMIIGETQKQLAYSEDGKAWRELFKNLAIYKEKLERKVDSIPARAYFMFDRGKDFGLAASDFLRPSKIKLRINERVERDKKRFLKNNPLPRNQALNDLKARHKSELQAEWDRQKKGEDRAEYQRDKQEAENENETIEEMLRRRFGDEITDRALEKVRERTDLEHSQTRENEGLVRKLER
ncbi:MAG: relaxase/mobilization nuclease domain-containing protein [Pseudomonadota bacterium]